MNIGANIQRSIVCPHCWREFPPGQIRFISESQGLRGDPIAGPTEQIRFRAMRFDAAGNALDPDGARCSRMACPNCHSEFARALVEIPSIPISIVGAPSSGKTNLLASGLWGLAQRAREFGFSLVDADPRFNASIHRNESILFSGSDPNADVTLPKTDVGGADLYRTVRIAGVEEMVPKPSYYIVSHDDNDRQSVMVLYDNAGEHFLPGSRVAGSESATRHLERSSAIIMVFDPLQDMRFRKRYGASANSGIAAGHQRQELVFAEAIARIRRLRGLAPTAPIDIPVIIALSKADVWGTQALGANWSVMDLMHQPAQRRRTVIESIKKVDAIARDVMASVAPEFTSTVRSLVKNSWFVPASALGTSPSQTADGRFIILASEIRPIWAEMPFVLAIALSSDPTVFPSLSRGAPT